MLASVGASSADQPSDKGLTMLGAAVPVTDLDRSLVFYTRGLGMQATPRREAGNVIEEPLIFPGGGPYLILLWPKTGHSTPYSPPPTQRVILDVPDLKALQRQLQANGIRLSAPIHENPEMHYAVAQLDDPDGNHIELVQRPR
jgi:predicted enzyme related to lactoylglutathione lyase